MTLSKEQMMSMPAFFTDVDDPRRREGRRHTLPSVLGLALAATLAGARGYKAISEWVKDLSPRIPAHFGVRVRNGTRIPPSRTGIRDVLVRVDPQQLGDALRAWTAAHGGAAPGLRPGKRKARTRPHRAEIDLGVHRDQRLREVPRCRAGLRRPPGGHRGQDRREARRDRLRDHQPEPGAASPPAGTEPRPLAGGDKPARIGHQPWEGRFPPGALCGYCSR